MIEQAPSRMRRLCPHCPRHLQNMALEFEYSSQKIDQYFCDDCNALFTYQYFKPIQTSYMKLTEKFNLILINLSDASLFYHKDTPEIKGMPNVIKVKELFHPEDSREVTLQKLERLQNLTAFL